MSGGSADIYLSWSFRVSITFVRGVLTDINNTKYY